MTYKLAYDETRLSKNDDQKLQSDVVLTDPENRLISVHNRLGAMLGKVAYMTKAK